MANTHPGFAAAREARNVELFGPRKSSAADIKRANALREIERRRLEREARQ